MSEFSVQYPRRQFIRTVMKWFGRTMSTLLTDTIVTGREHLPAKGPMILVGNHVAMIETAMMLIHVPWQVEMMASGDIPLEPRFAKLIDLWRIIPIKRGSMDREGMEMALDVLKQDGILGVFPEGGIWETSLRQARTGVAWLSNKSNAPIVPIGFAGIEGAIAKMLKFKRPRLLMNIGAPIPPVKLEGKARKTGLQDTANLVMERIQALIPEEYRQHAKPIYDERFTFAYTATSADGQPVNTADAPPITNADGLCKFIYRPVLLDAMARNLKRDVAALQNYAEVHDSAALMAAVDTALEYLTNDNPQFLNYRFGYDVGAQMTEGLRELRALLAWAGQKQAKIALTFARYYRKEADGPELTQTHPGAAHEI
jgi:1-acyl-sn-glycerol-3-phosphate acyltransferase